MADIDIASPGASDGALAAAITALHIGGYREVADLTARDAIPASRRVAGMVAYVVATAREYQLVGGTDNTNWTERSTDLSATVAPNILFDSYNSFTYDKKMFAGWDWYGGANPTWTLASTHIPLATPVRQATGPTSIDKFYDPASLGLAAGDTVTFAAYVWFENAGGAFSAQFLDSSGSSLGLFSVTGLASGLQTVYLPATVPSGSIYRIRIRTQQTTSGGLEVGGYFACRGTTQRPALSAGPIARVYADAIGKGKNLLWDPFGERLSLYPREGLPTTQAAAASYAGTLVSGSVNTPFTGKPTILNTGSTGSDRSFESAHYGLADGGTVTVRVCAWYASTGGFANLIWKDAAGATISSVTLSTTGAGLNDMYVTTTVPTGAAAGFFMIRAAGTSMNKELCGCALGLGAQVPDCNPAAIPPAYSNNQGHRRNLTAEPVCRRYGLGEKVIDGWGPCVTTGVAIPAYVTDFALSPFPRKRALLIPSGGGQTDMNFDVRRLGLKLGDMVTVKLGVYAWQSCNIAFFGRTATAGVVTGSVTANQSYVFASTGQYLEITKSLTVTQDFIDTAAYLQCRFLNGGTAGANGVYICAKGIFVGPGDCKLYDDAYDEQVGRFEDRRRPHGLATLRETHKRLIQRKLYSQFPAIVPVDTPFTLAHIGDSYTQGRDRYVAPLATMLQADYGDGGPGWIGLGYPSAGQFGLINGPAVLGGFTFGQTGTWTPVYNTAASPDLGAAESSDTSTPAVFKVNGFPTGITSLRLFALAQAGTVQVSYDGGTTWSASIDLSTGTGITVASLTGVPAAAFNLWIKVASGTVRLYGLDARKSLATGVVVHKLGGTGSTAAQWATQAATTAWRAGLTALAPNLVTVMLGPNDQTSSTTAAAFAGYVQAIATGIRTALPLTDVLVMMPPENGRGAAVQMASYAGVARDVALANNVGFLDLQDDYGDSPADYASTSARNWFNADLLHPDPATGGGLPIVAALRRAMIPA